MSEDAWVRDWLEGSAAGQTFASEQGLAVPLAPLPTEGCTADGVQPTVALTEPSPQSVVRGVVTVRGAVAEERFDSVASYSLSVAARRAGAEYEMMRDRAGQVQGPFAPPPAGTGGLLGSWDTTKLPDGEYTVRLRAEATEEYGGALTVEVLVTVRNGG